MNRASIGIFYKSSPKRKAVTRPHTPDEVFEAAYRVAETKQTEVIKKSDAMYVITYSESGPWKEVSAYSGNEKWLPVHVYKIEQWFSGGITEKEMENFIDGHNE